MEELRSTQGGSHPGRCGIGHASLCYWHTAYQVFLFYHKTGAQPKIGGLGVEQMVELVNPRSDR
jgi:hypothetical protein